MKRFALIRYRVSFDPVIIISGGLRGHGQGQGHDDEIGPLQESDLARRHNSALTTVRRIHSY